MRGDEVGTPCSLPAASALLGTSLFAVLRPILHVEFIKHKHLKTDLLTTAQPHRCSRRPNEMAEGKGSRSRNRHALVGTRPRGGTPVLPGTAAGPGAASANGRDRDVQCQPGGSGEEKGAMGRQEKRLLLQRDRF